MKTVTGNPISISNAKDIAAKNVVVEFSPKQDFNGYDHPWIGGAGKNKIQVARKTFSFSQRSGSPAATCINNQDGTVTFTAHNETGSGNINNTCGFEFIGGTDVPVGNYYYRPYDIGSSTQNVGMMIYDNTNKGRAKQWDGETSCIEIFDGTKAQVKIEDGVRYWLHIRCQGSGKVAENVVIKPLLFLPDAGDPAFEPYSNVCSIEGYTEIDIEQKTSVSSPTSQQYTVTWENDIGEVFGGSLNLTTGEMVSEWIYSTFNNIESKIGYNTTYFYITPGNKLPGVANVISSVYVTTDVASVDLMADSSIKGHPTNGNIYFKDSRYTSKSELLAGVGDETVCYKLATPITYHLTPTEITLLKKNNVLYTDGNKITLTYDEIDNWNDYPERINYLLACLAGDEEFDNDFKPLSRVEEILTCKLNGVTYTGDTISRLERLFAVWCGFKDLSIIEEKPSSRSEGILWSKIFGETYTGVVISRAEHLLMELQNADPLYEKTDAIVGFGEVDYAKLNN